jgi:hypothetical protein
MKYDEALSTFAFTFILRRYGLRGLRPLVASNRGGAKLAAKDEHGVERQLGYGSIDGRCIYRPLF